MKPFTKLVVTILVAALVVSPTYLYAGPLPSKVEQDQSLESLERDLTLAGITFDTKPIEEALAREGLTPVQIDARMAVLSTDDIRTLSTSPAQVRSAGLSLSRRTWTIIGVAAAAIAVGVVVLDDDDSDEGEEDDDD